MTDPGPGVHVVVHGDPLRAGRSVAEALGGALIDLPAMAEAVVQQRARLPEHRAARDRLAALEALAAEAEIDPPRRDPLLARLAPSLPDLAARIELDDPLTERLHDLTARLQGLEALQRRTARALLAAWGYGPPDEEDASPGLRAAAAAVVAEEEAVADAALSLDLHDLAAAAEQPPERQGHSAAAGQPDAPAADGNDDESDDEAEADERAADDRVAGEDDGDAEPDDEDGELEQRFEAEGPKGDASILMPLGIFFIGAFVYYIILALQWPTWAARVGLGVGVAAALLSRYSIKAEARQAREERADRVEAEAVLDLLGSAAPSDPSDDPAADDDPPEPPEPEPEPQSAPAVTPAVAPAASVDEGERRRQALHGAEERLRAAEAVWSSLAGPSRPARAHLMGADPIGEGLHPELLASSPALRAVSNLRTTLESEWTATWRALGRTAPPPDRSVVELIIADLHETGPDPAEARALMPSVERTNAAATARARLAEALGDDDLDDLRASAPDDEDLDDGLLVLVTPFDGLGDKRRAALRRQLDELPPGLTVVVVVRSATEVPRLKRR